MLKNLELNEIEKLFLEIYVIVNYKFHVLVNVLHQHCLCLPDTLILLILKIFHCLKKILHVIIYQKILINVFVTPQRKIKVRIQSVKTSLKLKIN
jgi:hypothetical protein